MSKPAAHECKQCGKITLFNDRNLLKRKKYTDLCGECAQLAKVNDLSTQPISNKDKKDWTEVYNDSSQTGSSLLDARARNLPYYQRDCPTCGPTVYSTSDQSCRICSRERGKRRNKHDPAFNRPRTILSSIRKRAKDKGIPYNLTLSYLRSIIPTHCPVLGIELSYDDNFETSPSVDRLDPTAGYVIGNVNVISNKANMVKNCGSLEDHLKLCLWWMTQDPRSLDDVEQDIIQQIRSQI